MCRAFGAADYQRLVADFHAAHTFEIVPSISSNLECPYHVDKEDPQMQQEHACEYERVTLCAADSLGDVLRQTDFLSCMDEAALPLAYNATFPHMCTTKAAAGDESAWSQTLECYTGSRGDNLVAQAQAETAAADAGIPAILVNGTQVCGNGVTCDYEAVARRLRE